MLAFSVCHYYILGVPTIPVLNNPADAVAGAASAPNQLPLGSTFTLPPGSTSSK